FAGQQGGRGAVVARVAQDAIRPLAPPRAGRRRDVAPRPIGAVPAVASRSQRGRRGFASPSGERNQVTLKRGPGRASDVQTRLASSSRSALMRASRRREGEVTTRKNQWFRPGPSIVNAPDRKPAA